MNKLSDKQLAILAATANSRVAFSELVRRHRPALLAFLLRLTGDDMDIEDIVQSAFVKAYAKIAQYRAEAHFKTWLFKIGYNEFLQYKRQQKSLGRLKQQLPNENDLPATTSDDSSLDLRAGLKQLSTEERAAILLCDAIGFTNEEASIAMNAPLGSVKTYVKRARFKMRIYLEGDN